MSTMDETEEPIDEPVEQVVEAYPVLAEIVAAPQTRPATIPVAHVAAIAGAGFVAGVATVALVRYAGSRRPAQAD